MSQRKRKFAARRQIEESLLAKENATERVLKRESTLAWLVGNGEKLRTIGFKMFAFL